MMHLLDTTEIQPESQGADESSVIEPGHENVTILSVT